MPYTQKSAAARKAGGVCMKSVILMFIGGMVGPVTALVGVGAGYLIGLALTESGSAKPSK